MDLQHAGPGNKPRKKVIFAGMTPEELDILLGNDIRDLILFHIHHDPAVVAMDKKIPHARVIATQIKYLQKARRKLPSWFEAGCIMTGKSYEQSSSETTASMRNYTGALAIDLTCGLGVDSYYLSRNFEKVISIERDFTMAETARINFSRLGANNITVINSTAEEFLGGNPNIKADLIFADPDRRNGSDCRLSDPCQCSPDIFALLPGLKNMASEIVIKLSPLYDVSEAFRAFGPGVTVKVISVDGECRETVIETFRDQKENLLQAVSNRYGMFSINPDGVYEPNPVVNIEPALFRYMSIPDAALVKCRMAARYFRENGWQISGDNSFAFTDKPTGNIFGRLFEIKRAEPYNPKRLRTLLREQDIRRLVIMKRNFPCSNEHIAAELGIKEGGSTVAAFTTEARRGWMLLLEAKD